MQIIVTMEKMLCAKPDNKWYFFRALLGGDGVPETTVICKGAMGWQPQEMETLSLVGDWVEYKGNGSSSSRARNLRFRLIREASSIMSANAHTASASPPNRRSGTRVTRTGAIFSAGKSAR